MAEKVSSTRWFGMAVQALVVLAENEGLCPSGKLAEKLESKSVFLRKILRHLVKAGLIHAKEGREGGYSLVKNPEDIKLSEVYEAMRAETFPKGFFNVGGKECFAPSTRESLIELRNDMESWVVAGLEEKTIADLIQK
ncbi:Rrf2 family transcriptional regulator [Halobacillus litoralis]|uniref:Rrf2 family transcriptional regulator n=1 Tax=Halobacillus litoralis TaxID=45668 RepID=A0A845DZF8_9BACI|nr:MULTISPECIES: Rrf2 family transcriptional regulator [Halobacillus]MCA1024199.1 Rrf2 family transcriptional regulator [Halobacillus litoralis]MYL21815.1 Rrf2 family transcriptional regulator [Halobacillus litoralis]MYL31813.1 Rrf2 family transcriptional regulator [Halobacillus halophilus]MYL39500.1 Rrf2 family transcriptional regulator [Halobacillus litoralis]